MSSLNEDQKWVPTHVQVTVLRGRGLRSKGKHGTSDVYTIIQLGKEKYSTCVVEKTTEPEWREECSFELQPGVLESGGRSGLPAGCGELVLTAMHRAVMGLDVFLGQAVIPLEKIFHETRCVKNEWYRLNSKTGKKEKERGEIQVTIQFTRNNLTASMYDLVMKDKGSSTFGKLKERIKGKKRSNEEDSSSAILPGGYGSLYRMRQRLPSDGGGEEDYEDDEGGEARRSKMRTFFLRGKLRKSSDTRSSTSLGSESSESSSRGGSLSPTAGISVVVSDLSNSPSNSSNLTADNSPEHLGDPSSLHCEFGDDTSEITIAVPEFPPCVNGSHVDSVQPVDRSSEVAKGSLGLGLLQKSLPLSTSLQNLSPRSLSDLPKGAAGDGRRWSFDKADDEEKAAITAALERREEDASSRQVPLLRIPSYSSIKESESQKKETSEQSNSEVKHWGWFGSKDSKPSLVVSPKLDRSTEPPPFGHAVDLVTPLRHTNPFCSPQAKPPPLSSCNPFFPFLQQNPFYEDINSAQSVKPVLPPLPFLSSARPPITQLFPQASNTNPTLIPDCLSVHPIQFDTDGNKASNASPEEEKPLSNSSDLFVEEQDLDESFDTFAAGRLSSPQETRLDCEENSFPGVSANVEPRIDHKMNPFINTVPDSSAVTPKVSSFSQLDLFSFGLDTIPEDESFENNSEVPNSPVELVTKSTTNASSNTNKLSSRSPEPSTSGLGSSSEEDFLSCNSSYSASDKVSAYSSDEALDFQPGSAPQLPVIRPVNKSESEEEIDRSQDWASFDGLQSTVVQSPDVDEEAVKVVSKETDTEVGQSVNISSVDSVDPQPECPEPHTVPEPSGSLQFDNAKEEECTSPQLQGSPEPTADIFSNRPSLFITTSSPDTKHQGLPFESKSLETSSTLPGTFLEFPVILGSDLDNSLLHTQTSEQSSAIQSLYMSTDSQNFHSCHSNPFTEGSNSADSTLCGELGEIIEGTDVGLEDTTNQTSTSLEEIHLSESPGISVNQDETSQINLENVPLESTASWNPFAGMLSESFEKRSVIVDTELWGTAEEVQQAENFGIAVDTREEKLLITNDTATKELTPELSSFTDSVDEKPHCMDLTRAPSVENHQSESFDKPADQTETPESSSNITNDGIPQEPPATSNTLDSAVAQSVEDGFENDRREAAAGEIQHSLDIDVVQAETSPKPNDLVPQESAASSNSSGDVFTDTLPEEPWAGDDKDPWGMSTGQVQPSETIGMAVDQKEKADSSSTVINGVLGSEQRTDILANLGHSLPGSEVKKLSSDHDNDTWTTPVEGSDGFGFGTDLGNPSGPSYKVSNDLFPEEPAASSNGSGNLFTGSIFESPWGIQDEDPWRAPDNAESEPNEVQQQSFIPLNDIIPQEVSAKASFSESFFDDPWGIQDDDPWSMPAGEVRRSESFGFERDPSLTTWPSVMHTKDFSATSSNLNDWSESFENPWGLRDSALAGKARLRSQSVGTLPTRLNKEHPPLFEFESVMLQESSSSQPDLPSLTSFAPSLIPESGSFSLPSNSNTSARSPPDIVGTAVPALAIAQPFLLEVDQQQEAEQWTSPHPVKPLTSATEGKSVLGKLKSTISPGKNSHLSEQETERRKSLTGGAGSYYHLTHSELVALLVQREAELEKQKREFQQQKTLLAKREVELKKLKPQVRDLEDYIDTLLVRIMEQKPTLLQVRTKLK